MASFQAKISWEMLRKSENKNKNRSDEFLLDPGQIIPKKIAKKFKKLKKKTIMASFQAKISWERPRKNENKKKSFRRVPIRPKIGKSKKIAKKFKKLNKTIMDSFQTKISWEWQKKKEKIKKIVTMSSYLSQNREF